MVFRSKDAFGGQQNILKYSCYNLGDGYFSARSARAPGVICVAHKFNVAFDLVLLPFFSAFTSLHVEISIWGIVSL